MSDPPAKFPSKTCCGIPSNEIVWYALPVILLTSLLITYWVAPDFYLSFVLEEHRKGENINREYQIVEIATFLLAFFAALILTFSLVRLSKSNNPELHSGYTRWDSLIAIGIVALSALFFAGEEISWGQSYFGWETPDEYRKVSVETNLHNSHLPVKTLGNLYLVIMFFILPGLWLIRNKWPVVKSSWRPAIPPGPVVFCMLLAFAWKLIKTIYLKMEGKEAGRTHAFYRDFIEQTNEHKELLIALALFMYGVFILRWIKSNRTALDKNQAA